MNNDFSITGLLLELHYLRNEITMSYSVSPCRKLTGETMLSFSNCMTTETPHGPAKEPFYWLAAYTSSQPPTHSFFSFAVSSSRCTYASMLLAFAWLPSSCHGFTTIELQYYTVAPSSSASLSMGRMAFRSFLKCESANKNSMYVELPRLHCWEEILTIMDHV